MLFAKIKEKLLNRRNDVEISEITDASGTPLDAEKMFALLSKVDFVNGDIIIKDCWIGIKDEDNNDAILIDCPNGELRLQSLLTICDMDEAELFPFSNNAGKVLVVNEDEDGLEAVDREIIPDEVITIQFTEDDYDSEEEVYSKEINFLSNKIYNIIPINNPVHTDTAYILYSPQVLSAVNLVKTTLTIDSFSGISYEPEERFISFSRINSSHTFAQLVNGCLMLGLDIDV